jgi:hypothetical protein
LSTRRTQAQIEQACSSCHAGQAGRAVGRRKHACVFLLKRAEMLRCSRCHPAGIPPVGIHRGRCPLVEHQRTLCSTCHPP